MRPHMSGKSSVVFVERQDCFSAETRPKLSGAQALAEHHERRAFRLPRNNFPTASTAIEAIELAGRLVIASQFSYPLVSQQSQTPK